MDFYEVLEQVLSLLQRHGRVSYRAMKRQLDLDDDYCSGQVKTDTQLSTNALFS